MYENPGMKELSCMKIQERRHAPLPTLMIDAVNSELLSIKSRVVLICDIFSIISATKAIYKGNVQISYDAIGGGGCSNRHKWLKKLYFQFILRYLRFMWGRELVENIIWGEGVG